MIVFIYIIPVTKNFGRIRSRPCAVCIGGSDVEIVTSYLGVQLDHQLEWSANTDAVYKKGLSPLYFL